MKRVLILLFLLILVGVPTYIYTSETFEREAPSIEIEHGDYWNLRDNFKIKISDKSGIKFYKVVLVNDNRADILVKREFIPSEIQKEVEVDLKLP